MCLLEDRQAEKWLLSLSFVLCSGLPKTGGCPLTPRRAICRLWPGDSNVDLIQRHPTDSPPPGILYQIDGHPRSGHNDTKQPSCVLCAQKGERQQYPETTLDPHRDVGEWDSVPTGLRGVNYSDQRRARVLPRPLPHTQANMCPSRRSPGPSPWWLLTAHVVKPTLPVVPAAAATLTVPAGGPDVSSHAGGRCRDFPGDYGK